MTYGTLLKQAIMEGDNELIDILHYPIDRDLYSQAETFGARGDINSMKKLIMEGVDYSHPYFDQPECIVINSLFDGMGGFDEVTEYLNFIFDIIDINCIGYEHFACTGTPATLIDMIDFALVEISQFAGTWAIKQLIKKGAKTAKALGITEDQILRLGDFDYARGYNYEKIKERKAALHDELLDSIHAD